MPVGLKSVKDIVSFLNNSVGLKSRMALSLLMLRRADEEALDVKRARFLLTSNIKRFVHPNCTNNTHAHQWVIGNSPVMFEIKLTKGFSAIPGTNRDSMLL